MLYAPKNYDRHEMPMDRIVVLHIWGPLAQEDRDTSASQDQFPGAT
jgi:hypothetical protein